MSNYSLSYIYALAANFSFAFASIYFARYSKLISPLWMNAVKAILTLVMLVLCIPFIGKVSELSFATYWPLLLSGFIGLTIGDLFLLKSFSIIGASRTLILFGFQPLLMAVASYLFFNQQLTQKHLFSIIILMGCLGLFSIEGFKKTGRWEFKGLLLALIAVLIDFLGILLSRHGFDLSQVKPIEGHLIRTFGAVLGFVLIGFFQPINLLSNYKTLIKKDKFLVIIASIFGTFLSLLFYMSAIKIGHLATISAIAITGPIFATLFESIYLKRWPGIYLWSSLILFIIGFIILF